MVKTEKISQHTNHVCLVVDRSGSMSNISTAVVRAFDGLVDSLKQSSIKHNQETRVSVYLFDDELQVLIFDMDVMRVPSLQGHYTVDGWTALASAVNQSMDDLEKVPAIYTDHAFLVYVLTDGDDNRSGSAQIDRLAKRLTSLPENWTIVAHVPNQQGLNYMKRLGFHLGNIEIWDVSESGVKEAVKRFEVSSDRYMTLRSQGIRGSSSYFQMDVSKLNEKTVKSNLTALSVNSYHVLVNSTDKAMEIRDLVESCTRMSYVAGSSYYSFSKPENIRQDIDILIRSKKEGRIYVGGAARKILGLDVVGTVKVKPEMVPEYEIFIQSKSYNRRIIPGQSVVVLK